MCGTVSFKKGISFYRGNKVTIFENTDDYCRALVRGIDDFSVEIFKVEAGTIRAKCNCPPLLNYNKYCQHIAAVLIAIHEQNKEMMITDEFMALFQNRKTRSTGHQYHFETREVLNGQVKLYPVTSDEGQVLFGIEVEIENKKVSDLRTFLQDFSQGKESLITTDFIFDPNSYCFPNGLDNVLHELARYINVKQNYNDEIIIIPPSSWPTFVKLLAGVADVSIKSEGKVYSGFNLVESPLPITFELNKKDDNEYQLLISRFENLTVLQAYECVLYEGKIYKLNKENCDRLFELKQMLRPNQINSIPIRQDQIDIFLKRIVPGLKKIGNVKLSSSLINEMPKTPLQAKVYLDRIKNRLLAGLEFQYEHVVIQPLETKEQTIAPHIYRDMEKEEVIFQLMEDSGFTRTEGGYFMQNEELEYDFLVHRLPQLQKLAQVYVTTAVRNRVIRNAQPKIRIKMNKERTNWLEFKFEMDGIAEKAVREILANLQVKRKYYRLPNGSLLSLETKEMEEVRKFLQEVPVQDDNYEATLERPILHSLKYLDQFLDNDVFTIEESFQQFIQQLMQPRDLDIPIPLSLEPILRTYQKDGYKWMKQLAQYGFGGVLADEMGLGKTLQSITYIVSELRAVREMKQPVLIVCPSSLTYNWLSEILSFAPEIEADVIDGVKEKRVQKLKSFTNVDVVITSYPLLRQDIKWYEKQHFHTIFFDEAQYFKNPLTQTARAVKKLQANHRFALTGTPMENSLEELWSIFYVVFPELFKGLEEFSHLTRKQIARRVRPFLLRRVKEDVLGELPDKEKSLQLSELLPEQKKLYTAFLAKLREETLKHLDKDTFEQNKIRILAGLTRLRQICCHPALFIEGYRGSSAKFEQLLQILEEASNAGRRVLIFSQFTKMLMLIGQELTRREQLYFYLDGQTPSEERVELCNRFNAGERDVFLISLKAGGTGLNLTGADTVILYDLWWNPAVEDQAIDRAHRIGQTETVKVIKMIARGTIEEKINDLQRKKKDLITDIIEPNGLGQSSLTEEDIREILMIDK